MSQPRRKPAATSKKTAGRASSAPKKRAPSSSTRSEARKTQYTPPPYDASAVGAIALRVEILAVELVAAHFERLDAEPIPREQPSDGVPRISIDVQHEITNDGTLIGCLLTFGTSFDGEAPYSLSASFRVLYSVAPGEPLAHDDVEVFSHYNAVFNVWPYWREYLSSTINRAQLPRFVLPVFRVPRTSHKDD